ncbi:MAG: ATP-binding protein [Verrucomicrobia bacterium]|nr:ATP-binding protein [Verrucomicrobiota bacterium]
MKNARAERLSLPNAGAPGRITQILEARDGTLWITTLGAGVYRFDGINFTPFTAADGHPFNDVTCVAEDMDSRLWFGTWENGISIYDGTTFETLGATPGLEDRRVQKIVCDRVGTIWFASAYFGASVYHGESYSRITTDDGLAGNDIADMIEDREGGLWFACNHAGISRLDPYRIRMVATDPIEECTAVTSQHEILLGSGNRVIRQAGYSRTAVELSGRVFALHKDSAGRTWAGTEHGLYLLESDSMAPTLITGSDADTPLMSVWCIAEDRDGVLWIGGAGGLRMVRKGDSGWRLESTALEGARHVVSLHGGSDGTMWACDNGTRCLHACHSQGPCETFPIGDHVPLECVIEDRDAQVWIGTGMGFGKFVDGAFEEHSPETELSSLYIKVLQVDSHDHLWVGTLGGGVIRFDGKNHQLLSVGDGLPSNSVTDVQETSSGDVLIATYKGTCLYRPETENAPTVFIRGVSPAKCESDGRYTLPVGSDAIAIHFHGISMNCKHLRYTYKLEGYDHTWKSTWHETVRYADLGPGEYAFQVRAISQDLVYSETSAQVTVSVTPDPRTKRLDELELRVEERTKELRAANIRLSAALTRLKESERQVIQSERLSALGQMSSGVAHDFNNTLMPIMGLTDLLIEDPDILDDRQETTTILKEVRAAAVHAADVVRRLRDFYRPADESDYDMVDLNQLILDVLDGTRHRWTKLQAERGVHIDVETELDDVPPICGSGSQLHVMLTNLVLNAGDAMAANGSISVSTSRSADDVLIRVRDSGMGMSKDVARRCFEPFFSTKAGSGTGIGLAVVYGVVQSHDGRIDVESEHGRGTTFSIILPVQCRIATSHEVEKPTVDTVHGLKVLIIDDDSRTLDIIEKYLRLDDHTVSRADRGRSGLELYDREPFDLVITDRAMPDISGDEVAVTIAGHSRTSPVILITGFGSIMNENRECPNGVTLVVGKPLSLSDLRQAVGTAMDAKTLFPS